MFCTSLRHRQPFAGIVTSVLASTSGLNLKESTLHTHDLSIPIPIPIQTQAQPVNSLSKPTAAPGPTSITTAKSASAHALHVLLLTVADLTPSPSSPLPRQRLPEHDPSNPQPAQISAPALARLRTFTALAAASNCAIVLLTTPAPTTTTSDQATASGSAYSSAPDAAAASMAPHALTLLSLHLATEASARASSLNDNGSRTGIAVLPLARLSQLAEVVDGHARALEWRELRKRQPADHDDLAGRSRGLVALCSAGMPLGEEAVRAVGGAFGGWRAFLRAVLVEGRGYGEEDGEGEDRNGSGIGELLGACELRDVVDFWKEEYYADL